MRSKSSARTLVALVFTTHVLASQSFGVQDFDQAERRLRARSVKIEALQASAGCVTPLVLADPDGNPIQIHRSSRETAAPSSALAALEFIAGAWRDESPGRVAEEHWMAPAGNSMVGMGRLVIGDETAFFEYLRIEARTDGIYYIASPRGRGETAFRLIESVASKVVFENKEHDFPSRIAYWLDVDGNLHARVEGVQDGKPAHEDFAWRRSALAARR